MRECPRRAPLARKRSTIAAVRVVFPDPVAPVTMTQKAARTAAAAAETTRRLAIWSIFAATSDGRRHSPRSPVSAAVNAGSAEGHAKRVREPDQAMALQARENRRIAEFHRNRGEPEEHERRAKDHRGARGDSAEQARKAVANASEDEPGQQHDRGHFNPERRAANPGERARVGAKRKGGRRGDVQDARPPRY